MEEKKENISLEEEKENKENVSISNETVDKAEIKKEKKFIKKLEKENQKLKEENESLNEQILKLNDSILRKQADFENYRKRVAEDRQKDRKYALQDFFSESIEVLDIFDLAVSNKTDDEKLQKYLSGFQMINNRLKNILENNGVSVIDCLNKPFDPAFCSAMESVEVEGVEPNIVVEVVMRGYVYKDRVLRPAMVKVSK